jgi:hypothetical protein
MSENVSQAILRLNAKQTKAREAFQALANERPQGGGTGACAYVPPGGGPATCSVTTRQRCDELNGEFFPGEQCP